MIKIKELKKIGFRKYNTGLHELRINKGANKGTFISYFKQNAVYILETRDDSILLKIDCIEDLELLIKIIAI